MELEKSPANPQKPRHEANEERDSKGLPVNGWEVGPRDVVRLSQVLRDIRESLRHWLVFLSVYRLMNRLKPGNAACPPWPEKIDVVSDGTSTIPVQNVMITATAWSP